MKKIQNIRVPKFFLLFKIEGYKNTGRTSHYGQEDVTGFTLIHRINKTVIYVFFKTKLNCISFDVEQVHQNCANSKCVQGFIEIF